MIRKIIFNHPELDQEEVLERTDPPAPEDIFFQQAIYVFKRKTNSYLEYVLDNIKKSDTYRKKAYTILVSKDYARGQFTRTLKLDNVEKILTRLNSIHPAMFEQLAYTLMFGEKRIVIPMSKSIKYSTKNNIVRMDSVFSYTEPVLQKDIFTLCSILQQKGIGTTEVVKSSLNGRYYTLYTVNQEAVLYCACGNLRCKDVKHIDEEFNNLIPLKDTIHYTKSSKTSGCTVDYNNKISLLKPVVTKKNTLEIKYKLEEQDIKFSKIYRVSYNQLYSSYYLILLLYLCVYKQIIDRDHIVLFYNNLMKKLKSLPSSTDRSIYLQKIYKTYGISKIPFYNSLTHKKEFHLRGFISFVVYILYSKDKNLREDEDIRYVLFNNKKTTKHLSILKRVKAEIVDKEYSVTLKIDDIK